MNDKELTINPKVENTLKTIEEYSTETKIQSIEDIKKAGEKLIQIAELKKTLEDQRTEFTKPLNLSLKNINAFFKKFSIPLDKFDKTIRGKIVEYGNTIPETAFGTVNLKKHTTIEIIDEKKIPRKYLSPDMAKIKLGLLNNETIEGIEVKEEKICSL